MFYVFIELCMVVEMVVLDINGISNKKRKRKIKEYKKMNEKLCGPDSV